MTHDGPQRTKDHNDHQRSTTTHNDPKSAHNDSNKNSQRPITFPKNSKTNHSNLKQPTTIQEVFENDPR